MSTPPVLSRTASTASDELYKLVLDDPSCSQTLERTASTASDELYQLALDDPGCLRALDDTASTAAAESPERFQGNPRLTQDSPLWQGDRSYFFWLRGRERDGAFRGQRPKTLGAIEALVKPPHWPLRHRQYQLDYDCSETREREIERAVEAYWLRVEKELAAEQDRWEAEGWWTPPGGYGPPPGVGY